ncbi:PQQ-binding-like beta-propeller repeat protein [Pseudovibrio sp. Tun.PSC04-5.I4]|uniref:outer membrane protein assembly factor BamB family protein n=1 Tax=Pseudovibrio sp. Tun.PSC04-5.I4 TaxID=1798213 RepID=UPI000883C6FA|nr:PQQ-binding-like beta-propeller repeat protein [Pseudovibrio sp. Tun.PSC04-5.I4]SDQ94776.1 Outer membrane protein assembly factor BamB, contains PQQ-like beta-propeller repeat [Pseudovibrio sp. Tun.PSC04-5.I4]
MSETKGKSWKTLIGTGALALTLAGCSSLSSLNPFGADDEFLEGDRLPLYQGATSPQATGGAAKIGAATGGSTWPTAAGPKNNDPGNIAINVSGGVAWSSNIGKVRSPGFFGMGSSNPRTAARPVSDGQRIYVYKPDGTLVALTTAGAKVFTKDLGLEGENEVAAGGGVVLDGDKIFVATAYRNVFGLDKGGNILWTKKLETPVRGAPAAANGKVIVVTQDNEVIALNQTDGEQAWSFAGIAEKAGLLSSANPAVSGNTVVVPFSSGEVMALDINSGEPKWIDTVARSFRTRALSGLTDVSASPVIDGNQVFASSVAGRTLAISLRDGERLWEADFGAVHTPVVSGGTLFLIGLDDKLHALSAKTGNLIWTAKLPAGEKDVKNVNWAGPILANGQLIAVSSNGYLASVNAKTGQASASRKVTSGVFVSPIVAGGRMVVLTSDGAVAALN